MPKEEGYVRKVFPRISFTSQDKTSGKGKAMVVTEEAGSFFIEKPSDELNEKGKKIWTREELGKSFEGIIFFTRKKLSFYDSASGKFISSSYFDQDSDVTVLWQDGKEIARGTKQELQAPYKFKKDDGKMGDKLQENKVLYVYYNDEIFELTIKSTSMYNYQAYAKSLEANKQLTLISSEEAENGATRWNKTTYTKVRQLTQAEYDTTRFLAIEMNDGIAEEKKYFASMNTDVPALEAKVEEDWSPDALPAGAMKPEF